MASRPLGRTRAHPGSLTTPQKSIKNRSHFFRPPRCPLAAPGVAPGRFGVPFGPPGRPKSDPNAPRRVKKTRRGQKQKHSFCVGFYRGERNEASPESLVFLPLSPPFSVSLLSFCSSSSSLAVFASKCPPCVAKGSPWGRKRLQKGWVVLAPKRLRDHIGPPGAPQEHPGTPKARKISPGGRFGSQNGLESLPN